MKLKLLGWWFPLLFAQGVCADPVFDFFRFASRIQGEYEIARIERNGVSVALPRDRGALFCVFPSNQTLRLDRPGVSHFLRFSADGVNFEEINTHSPWQNKHGVGWFQENSVYVKDSAIQTRGQSMDRNGVISWFFRDETIVIRYHASAGSVAVWLRRRNTPGVDVSSICLRGYFNNR